MFHIFGFRMMPDFGGGTTVLQDAYVDIRFPRSQGPGRQIQAAARTRAPDVGGRDALHRARAADRLVPNRDLGRDIPRRPRLSATWLAAGVFNGVVDGGSTRHRYTGRQGLRRAASSSSRSARAATASGRGSAPGSPGVTAGHRGISAASSALPFLPNGRPERVLRLPRRRPGRRPPPSPTGRTPASPRRCTTTLEPSGSWANTCFLPRKSAAALPTPPSITRHGRWPVRGS